MSTAEKAKQLCAEAIDLAISTKDYEFRRIMHNVVTYARSGVVSAEQVADYIEEALDANGIEWPKDIQL